MYIIHIYIYTHMCVYIYIYIYIYIHIFLGGDRLGWRGEEDGLRLGLSQEKGISTWKAAYF